ncbi:GAF domain-containing sensor histidine kinase [Paenibacillus hamazuiensis]|uniref:GAF domain-containing sensor histidine kinase n=1 Tax=Paenibacillus hamazuiensis TaxID=2936508 RepID=UPI00200E70A8|nr:GAF domain-containing sensor histidine kinase [Paenibacillus hamazuiensis]
MRTGETKPMRLKSFEKLFHMTKMINSRFEMSEILQVLVDAIAGEIAQADLVGFFLKGEDGIFHGLKGNKMPVDITQLFIDTASDPFVRDIIEQRTSIYIPDTSLDRRADSDKTHLLKIKSIFGVPVFVEDDIFGLVFVHDFGKPMNLTEEQMEVTEAFVNMASVAIRNIRMFEQKQHLLERQQLLLDATNALSKSLSVHEVLRMGFHYLQKAAGTQDVGIHMFNEKERILYPFHLSGANVTEDEWKNKHKTEGINLSIDKDRLFFEVINGNRAIAIPDVYADPRPNHEACKTFDIYSLLLVPLVAKGKVFGVVIAPSIHEPKKFTESEIEICQSVADITATALSNALHAENLDNLVKERTVELQQVNFKLQELVKELQFLNELKNDFIASLSHELRTPITAVKGSVDILKRGILGELNAAQMDLIETSNKAIERLLNQVNELLDFAKLESGKFELAYSEVSFADIVNEAVAIVESLFGKKKQKLLVELQTELKVRVDRQRILQILLNLLANANKFTPAGGVIKINGYLKDSSIIVEVQDNGIGIPQEKQKHIFTKFYQANNQVNGTGLGLAISKQLIELHGGRIWFDSIEGQGTTFTFTLPKEGAMKHAGS